MKTKLLIIIGIVFVSIGLGSFAYVITVQNQCESLLGDTHYPRPLTLWNCLDYLRMVQENPEPDVTDSLKIPNAERDAKLAAGYKLYPGVGWVHPDDLGNQQPIYRDNPNNPGELILDIDAMIKEYDLDQETLPESIPNYVPSTQEHYEIEITGLKDVYLVGEPYSFSYTISGYGHSCANREVAYPDENGNTVGTSSMVLCAPETLMHEFKINYSDKGTLGNVAIKIPGTYVVTVTFEKPSKYFPTTVSKEFRVMEN